MRVFGKMALAMGVVALLTAPAMAQQGKGQGRGGFGMGGGGGAAILMSPNVQKDLKLTDTQVGKIQQTLTDIREKHADDYAALRNASPEERQAKMQTLNETVSDEVKKALALTSEQSMRYDQIHLQSRGLQAFNDPAVAAKLKLTDDQKSKIRDIAEGSRGSFAGAFNKDASEEERAAARKKMAETQKDNLAKAQALLTDDQKKAWKELTGDPIEIQYPTRRPNN